MFNSSGTVKAENNALLQIDDAKVFGGTVTDNGTVEISGLSSLSNVHLNIGAGDALTIDPGATLTLSGATISGASGAAINDGTSGTGGTIDVFTSSAISGVSLDNGGVMIAAGQTLTLDNDTATGVTITDNGNGNLHVDAGDTLTFSGIALTGGAIGNSGTLNISGPSTLANTTLSGGQVTLDVPLPGLAATDQGTVVQFTGSGFDAARVFSPAVAEVNGGYTNSPAKRPAAAIPRSDWRLRATA